MALKTFIRRSVPVCILCLLCLSGCATLPAPEKTVAVESWDFSHFPYSSFLKNWDDQKTPVFTAVITSPAEFAALFSPAAVMGNSQVFAPDPQVFDHHFFVVIARVEGSSDDPAPSFQMDRLIDQGTGLRLDYTYHAPGKTGTFMVKQGLLIKVPQGQAKALHIYENHRQLGTLVVPN